MFRLLIFIGLKLLEFGKVLGVVTVIAVALSSMFLIVFQVYLWCDPSMTNMTPPYPWNLLLVIYAICSMIGWPTFIIYMNRDNLKYWISANWRKAGRIEGKFRGRNER